MYLSTNLVGAGQLALNVPLTMRRRRLYFGIVWSGWNEWDAEANLELARGADIVQFHAKWGTTFESMQASSSWSDQSNFRTGTSGLPSYSVRTYDTKSTPNWGQDDSGPDAITWSTIHRPNLSDIGFAVTMFPLQWVGEIDTVRFFFTRSLQTSVLGVPGVEVYLGCLSD